MLHVNHMCIYGQLKAYFVPLIHLHYCFCKMSEKTMQWLKKRQTMNYKTLQNTTLKIKPELHEPRFKPGVTSGVPKRLAVPAPPVTPVMLMLNDMNIIWYENCVGHQYVYVIWMWTDWYRKYQPAEPEYEICWRVSEANDSETSYSLEQADIFQYQSYSHSDDIFIILKSTINTDTSILVLSREKLRDSKYSKYASLKP